jgi:hypothetical protein
MLCDRKWNSRTEMSVPEENCAQEYLAREVFNNIVLAPEVIY